MGYCWVLSFFGDFIENAISQSETHASANCARIGIGLSRERFLSKPGVKIRSTGASSRQLHWTRWKPRGRKNQRDCSNSCERADSSKNAFMKLARTPGGGACGPLSRSGKRARQKVSPR